MAVHTPGPWEVIDGTVVSTPIDTVTMVTLKNETEPRPCHSGMVAIVYGHHVGDAPDRVFTHDANARLIAATPDLLTALRRINDCACYTQEDASPENREAMLQEIGRVARTAIAKTEGEA